MKNSSLLQKNKEFIIFLNKLKPHQKKLILRHLSSDYINTLSEICHNFLLKNLTSDSKVIQKVEKYKSEVRKLARKKNTSPSKKKVSHFQKRR